MMEHASSQINVNAQQALQELRSQQSLNFQVWSSNSQLGPVYRQCSRISNDKKETFVSYQILIPFNVRILHMSWKHSQISLFNSSVHEKVAWNAQQKYLNHMMHKWHTGIYLSLKSPHSNLFNSSFIFWHLLPSVFNSELYVTLCVNELFERPEIYLDRQSPK